MSSRLILEMLKDIPLPKMVKVRQIFSNEKIASLEESIILEFKRRDIINSLKGRKRIALAVGSRGIRDLPQIVRQIVRIIKASGIDIFIVPAMGSHGGATSAGQTQLLESMGISESYTGARIISSMDIVKLGTTAYGLPVFIDKNAYDSDGIILLNRIKPHTAFRGKYESGLLKQAAVGLGKQKGAEVFHSLGLEGMSENLVQMAEVVFSSAPILIGVAIVENAYDEISRISVLPGHEIFSKEPILLLEAKRNMPKFHIGHFDVLIVEQFGKNISGDGMDPNITGRFYTKNISEGPQIKRIVVLDLTDESHGNAIGAGMADFAGNHFYSKFDREQVYINVLTNCVTEPAKIPLIMDTDELAIKAAIKTCIGVTPENIRLVRIKDTLSLGEIMISEAMMTQAQTNDRIQIVEKGLKLVFNSEGRLI